MILLRLENSERRKRLNSALFRQKISICNSYSAKSIPRVTDLDKPSRRGLNISICNT